MEESGRVRFECEGCGTTFGGKEAAASRWGDAACPQCGSERIRRVVTNFQKLFAFLLTYEAY